MPAEGSTMQIVYTVIAVVGLSAILTLFSKRQRDSSWHGNVTNIKKYSYRRNDDSLNEEEGMTISYRTDAGKGGKFKVSMLTYNQLYSELKVGDKIVKEKGEYLPKTTG